MNPDSGPFLVCCGDLSVGQIMKAGAPLFVGGRLTAMGLIYCFYNHSSFRALGAVKAKGLFIDDHLFQVEGLVEAPVYVHGIDDPKEMLAPDLLWSEDQSAFDIRAERQLRKSVRTGGVAGRYHYVSTCDHKISAALNGEDHFRIGPDRAIASMRPSISVDGNRPVLCERVLRGVRRGLSWNPCHPPKTGG